MEKIGRLIWLGSFGILMSQSVALAEETFMQSPPPKFDRYEKSLTEGDVIKLPCLIEERKTLAKSLGAIVESEKASHSERFGYIFRYTIAAFDDPDGKSDALAASILVLWTVDCKKFSGATYPGFSLPQSAGK
jgi:hypothetical protein